MSLVMPNLGLRHTRLIVAVAAAVLHSSCAAGARSDASGPVWQASGSAEAQSDDTSALSLKQSQHEVDTSRALASDLAASDLHARAPPYYSCGADACVEASSELTAKLGVSYFWGPEWAYPKSKTARYRATFKCGVTFAATSQLGAKVTSTRDRAGDCKTCKNCDVIEGTWKQTASAALTCEASATAFGITVSIGADLAKLIFSFSLGVKVGIGDCSEKFCIEGSAGVAAELDSGCVSVGYGWFSIGIRGTMRKAGKCTGTSCAAPSCGDDGSSAAVVVCIGSEGLRSDGQDRSGRRADHGDPKLGDTIFECVGTSVVEVASPFTAIGGAGTCKYHLELHDVILSENKSGYLLAEKQDVLGAFNGTIACASNIQHEKAAQGGAVGNFRNITNVTIECALLLENGTLLAPLQVVVDAPNLTSAVQMQAAWINSISCSADVCILQWFADSTMQFANIADGDFRPSADGTYATMLFLRRDGLTVGNTTKTSNFTTTHGEDFGADVMNASDIQGCEPSPTPPFTPAPAPTTAPSGSKHEGNSNSSSSSLFARSQAAEDQCTECDPNAPDGGTVSIGATSKSTVEIGGWPVPVIGGELKVKVVSEVAGTIKRPSCKAAVDSGSGVCESSKDMKTTASVEVTLAKFGASIQSSWSNSVKLFQCLECGSTTTTTAAPNSTTTSTTTTSSSTSSPSPTPSPTWRSRRHQ